MNTMNTKTNSPKPRAGRLVASVARDNLIQLDIDGGVVATLRIKPMFTWEGRDLAPEFSAAITAYASQSARIAELEAALADLLAFDDKDDPRHQEVAEEVYETCVAREEQPTRNLLVERARRALLAKKEG